MLMSTCRPEVESNGLLLRQWTAADFDFYAAYLGNEQTAQYIGGAVNKHQAWRHLASLIGHWALRGFGVYAVEDLVTRQLQGCSGLWEPHGWPCREFVFWFTADAYGSGRAVRAARLSIDVVNAAFSQEAITGFIHPKNHLALALASEIGGTIQGEEPLFEFGPHIRIAYRNAKR
jgi:RimJ/RimL family protein N-acetyltransferase